MKKQRENSQITASNPFFPDHVHINSLLNSSTTRPGLLNLLTIPNMKTIQQLSSAAMLLFLILSSCRPINETTGLPSSNLSTQTEVNALDETKDPPKDVPKDRDNWKIKNRQKH